MEKINEIKKQEKNYRYKKFVLWLVIFLVFLVVFLSVFLYNFSDKRDGFFGVMFKVIPYPAIVFDYSNFIFLSDVRKNVESLQRFYENQDFSEVGMRVDFSTEDGKGRLKIKEKDVLNKMIEDKAIEILAKKRGINITDKQVKNGVLEEIQKNGNNEESAEENLKRLYGWTLVDFEKRIVTPEMYKEQLREAIKGELASASLQAKDTIEKAKKELDQGRDFAEVANKYSQGFTAKNGGEIGWITKDQLDSEIAKNIFGNHDNNKNDVIESLLGYHIVKVEEIKVENGVDMVRLKQIIIRKKTFIDWLDEKIKEMKISILIRGYYWNDEKQIIDFRDEDMRKKEKEIIEKSQGDASIIF